MNYKVLQKRNPLKENEPWKWYAQIVLGKEVTMSDLVVEIEKFSALSEPDIRGVIIALENSIKKKLADGHIVRFDTIGSFYPSLSSNPSETEKEVTAANIRSVRVNYRAGKGIMDAVKNAPKDKVK